MEQKKIEWIFHIHVSTISGHYVESTIARWVSEEEYILLELGRREHLELEYNADLADIYEEVCFDAYIQEESRFEKGEEYTFVEDFDEECVVDISY